MILLYSCGLVSASLQYSYVQKRFDVSEHTWPPTAPKEFTPVVLTYVKKQPSFKEAVTITETIHTGRISEIIQAKDITQHAKRLKLDQDYQILAKALRTSTVTRNIADIFENCSDSPIILVEGAPGIGKSILMNHIAYEWAKGILLHDCRLVLLIHLSDPFFQHATSLEDIFHGCLSNISIPNLPACCDYMVKSYGRSLAFLIDGYDQFPDELKKKSVVSMIISRKFLHQCTLVVSSRPHALQILRHQATLQVNILGFTEEDRDHLIKNELKYDPHKIVELTLYLQKHRTVNSLCFTPFNLTVLVSLFKSGFVLPRNSTELYQVFIYATIKRHLLKSGSGIDDKAVYSDIKDFPTPIVNVLHQLSHSALYGINNNRFTFTMEQISSSIPDIDLIPGAINGFGLLQTVQNSTQIKSLNFHFIHVSIQEYLAAYYVSTLPESRQLSILEEYFWSELHYNMFIFYVVLTKGQTLKQYLCGYDGDGLVAIKNTFLRDPLKCCHLYQCFYEIGDHVMCSTLEAVFSDNKVLNLSDVPLSLNNVQAIIVMITCSSINHWIQIDLSGCHIQDYGARLLHRSLKYSGVTIEQLNMHDNNLTEDCRSDIEELLSINKG